MKNKPFTFEMSLSLLNHLGRNLYRSFITVLGEAISNSWDADAKNVWIYIDKENNNLIIKDDGDGMSRDDFQNKFLKIGYSKRKKRINSPKGRPYIGRKGIGKLALLSCADRITIISKKRGGNYIGGMIDNSDLDKAITEDLTPQQYPLGEVNQDFFKPYIRNQKNGTIVYFENVTEGIKNSLDYLKKIIALYFRFSLLDSSFNIFLGNEKITIDCLDSLSNKTEFLWKINNYKDPYIKKMLTNLKEIKSLNIKGNIEGFIASVERPRCLKIFGTGEKIGVDLFVNGRVRERDILKHIPTARVAENYFYGQIHFDKLDDKNDRFATGREGIVADDPKYKNFLNNLRKVISVLLEDWDKWRLKHKEDGDPENMRISEKDRKSKGLYNAVSKEYALPEESKNRKKVDGWVDDLSDDARYNFISYAECFISENLIRKYIQEKKISLSREANNAIKQWQEKEEFNKNKGNVSIEIRKKNTKLSYLSMDDLANLVDKAKNPTKEARLSRDANQYKPIRDALAHTALLTDVAKQKLTSVYENIKERIRTLLSSNK